MKKIARRNFLKLVGVSASIPILQSLPIASASATDLSDYPLLKDGIFDFENTDITQYVDDVQEVFGSEKDMIEEMLSSGELTPQDLKQHLLELAEQPSSVLVERGFSESQIAIIEEYDGIEDAFDYLYAPNERTGIARSSATVKFLYGLAGSGSRQKVTIAYDIKWSERPIYVGIDSFGIGWMLGDEKPYATFGTGRHFVTRPATAGMTGSVKIGDFKLSSDINKVIVKSSSLQAYNLTKATWQSSIEFSGMVWVK